ncbi:NepR family anti-sigma factor [Sphingobium phenoxybenzoativorans]|nr:NepR family anti-sigma factor [Sphingobium phenoxybenzoativorans]
MVSDMRPDNIVEEGAPGGRDGNAASGAAPAQSARPKNPPKSAKTAPKTPSPKTEASNSDSAVGNVLRSVYQKAVDEAIPAEMLDLLSKLD